MPEHRIRLRAAWERLGPGDPAPRRVDLPVAWSPGEPVGTITLRRGFGTPRIDPGRETIDLEIAEAPGVVAVRLNGQILAGPTFGTIRVPISDLLQPRNVVEIDADGADVPPAPPDRRWGEVALVIVER